MNSKIIEQLEEARETGVFALEGESLGQVPAEIRDLTDLRELSLVECSIPYLPDWLPELSLERLDLGHNPVAGWEPIVAGMRSLRGLGLSGVQLVELDDALSRLTNLEVLVAPANDLASIPGWIGELRNLRILDLGCNPISHLPVEIERLQRLTQLYLWGHRLEEIPRGLAGLAELQMLDMSVGGMGDPSGDQSWRQPISGFARVVGSSYQEPGPLTQLPDWIADGLPSLRVLELGGQRLESLPPRLPMRLRRLYLHGNRLATVPQAILDLPSLEALDLRGNELEALPAEIRYLDNLTYLGLADNPLPIPPEVLAEPTRPAAIIEFVARIRGAIKRLDQAKLLVVGEGSVGKTSLIKRLVHDEFSIQEGKTEGIERTRWALDVDGDPILLNVWDFGGQEIMHATHQFFLTKRSLYVLVIDARQGEEQNRIEYWLKLIQSFSDASPVVIVTNKCEQSPLDMDTRGLRKKYPNIVAILPTSCKTGEGIDEVRDVLAASIERMPHVRDLLPASFFDVKRDLEEMDVDYVPYASYEELCRGHGIEMKEEQELLVGFLHDLGTVLCFREDPRLSDTNILNPEWVTAGVYRLLNSHLAGQRKGLLSWDDVDAILSTSDYPPERRAFIVDMMKRFELCYESEGTFLVPDLLTKEEPDTGSWDGAVKFEVKYDVLPSSVISRLIVRMNQRISKGTLWRTGLVVAMDRNRGLIKGDREDAVVEISITGPTAARRGLLTAIRGELRAIEATIPGLVSEERVPVPGHPGIWVPYRHLLDLEAAGREVVVPQGLVEDFGIRNLLAGVEAPSDRSLSRTVSPRSVERPTEQAAESRPWTPAEAFRMGVLLFVALGLLVAIFVGANLAVGGGAATAITAAALAAVVGVASFVLRSSGRLSEDGFLVALQQVMQRE
jgi:internalin A